MTPERFEECLDILGLSKRKLSEMLATHKTTVQRWSSGGQPIPDNLEDWLEELVRHREAHPLPVGWRENKSPGYVPNR